MKKKGAKKYKKIDAGAMSVNIALVAVFLLCGITVGCILAYNTELFKNSSALAALGTVRDAANGQIAYSFWQAFFNIIKYPLIIFILGFTFLGVFITPVIAFIKGFFVSFSVSAVILTFGKLGIPISLALFGIQTMISIPAVLLISAASIEISKSFSGVMRKNKGVYTQSQIRILPYIAFFSITAVFLLVFTFLDVGLTPSLISLATKQLIP